MTTTTRKRGGLGGGGKRGGGGGGGGESRKTPTKTRKTTTTRATTTTTTKDAEKKNACVDFLSFFFLSFSEGAVKNKRNFLRERARARAGDLGVVIRVSKSSGGATKKRPSVSRDGGLASFSFSARPRGRIRFVVLSLSLSLSLTQLSNFLSLSLSLSARSRRGFRCTLGLVFRTVLMRRTMVGRKQQKTTKTRKIDQKEDEEWTKRSCRTRCGRRTDRTKRKGANRFCIKQSLDGWR